MKTFPALSFTCPVPWADMQGSEKERFCNKCSRSVVNISLMTEEARAALLAAAKPGELCVAYYKRLNGECVSAENPLKPSELSRLRQYGVAAISAGALALAACAPAPEADEPAKEIARPEAVEAPVKEGPPTMILGVPICTPPPQQQQPTTTTTTVATPEVAVPVLMLGEAVAPLPRPTPTGAETKP